MRTEKLRKSIGEFDGFYVSGKANIFYYSGFTSEDAALLITADRKIIITDSRYTIQAKLQAADFEFFNISDGLGKLFDSIKAEKIGIEENYLTVSGLERLKKAASGIEFIPAQKEISAPRRIKEPIEIEKIRSAEALGDAAFLHILNFIRAGVSENEVAYELESYMRRNGASATSFETIVASGVRSAMPHGVASDKIIEKGDFVTLDFGCVLDGYCSDMTRTVIVGSADSRQREIYEVVKKAQQAALDAIKAGVSCKDTDAVARKIITEAGYGENFGHSLGHSLGIEIHENPNFSPKSEDFAETGNVLSVEPGIYIDGFGGVRIEDIVAITPKNGENLTKSKKDLIII